MAKKLIRNHSKDDKVTFQWPAEGVDFVFSSPRGKNPGSLEFGEGIVRIGTNKNGKIKSFICPQVEVDYDAVISGKEVRFKGLGEVEIDYVRGSIDPVTGQGKFLLKEAELRYWGEYTSDSENWSVTKQEGAIIPLRNTKGGKTLRARSEETPKDGSFVTFLLNAVQKNPVGIQKGLRQEKIIELIKNDRPGYAREGTSLAWTINTDSPIPVIGNEYVDLAHALHMGNTTSGQAL